MTNYLTNYLDATIFVNLYIKNLSVLSAWHDSNYINLAPADSRAVTDLIHCFKSLWTALANQGADILSDPAFQSAYFASKQQADSLIGQYWLSI